jgi:hypothetical protein
LTQNTRAYLLGIEKHPRFILGQKNTKQRTGQIALWWMKLWLLPWIGKESVLERVAAHNFVHPIRHGARAQLPQAE